MTGRDYHVGYNRKIGALLALAGIANIVLFAVTGSEATTNVLIGTPLAILGVLYLVRDAVVVTPREVQVKNPLGMTMKRVPIGSLAELRFDGKKLVHVPSGGTVLRTGSLGGEGLAALRAAVEDARPGAG
ncbi:MAG: hypothetical protein KDC33_06225 [Thermoleophilia bacterium]|nr:hypothetical protein [Thermoleophilia bacterium]